MATGWEDNTYPTINTDLIAQTVGNLAVNIAAQAIGNLSIDVAAQTIAQTIQREKSGSFHSDNDSILNAGVIKLTLLTVTGKGRIYGLYLTANHTSSGIASTVFLTVDTVLDYYQTWSAMNTMELDFSSDYLLKLTKYNTTDHIYSIVGFQNVTFETNFILAYTPSVANGTISFLVNYTLL